MKLQTTQTFGAKIDLVVGLTELRRPLRMRIGRVGKIAGLGALLTMGMCTLSGCGGQSGGPSGEPSCAGNGGSGVCTEPSPQPEAPMPCEGVCLPWLVGRLRLTGFVALEDLSVDPVRQRVYAKGQRIDVSNPRAMKVTPLPKPGHAGVNPATGRYITTDTEGHDLFVFNADDTLYDSQRLPGALTSIAADPVTGLHYLTTKNENQLVVYDEGSRVLSASRPLDVSPGGAVFDPGSDQVFVNWYTPPGATSNYEYHSLIVDKNYDTGASVSGYVLATEQAQRLVYVEGSPDSRLEIRTSESWDLAEIQLDTDAYWAAPDPVLNRLYVRQLYGIAVFDQSSGDLLGSLPLSDKSDVMEAAFAPGDNRIYVEVLVNVEDAVSPYRVDLLVFATQ